MGNQGCFCSRYFNLRVLDFSVRVFLTWRYFSWANFCRLELICGNVSHLRSGYSSNKFLFLNIIPPKCLPPLKICKRMVYIRFVLLSCWKKDSLFLLVAQSWLAKHSIYYFETIDKSTYRPSFAFSSIQIFSNVLRFLRWGDDEPEYYNEIPGKQAPEAGLKRLDEPAAAVSNSRTQEYVNNNIQVCQFLLIVISHCCLL